MDFERQFFCLDYNTNYQKFTKIRKLQFRPFRINFWKTRKIRKFRNFCEKAILQKFVGKKVNGFSDHSFVWRLAAYWVRKVLHVGKRWSTVRAYPAKTAKVTVWARKATKLSKKLSFTALLSYHWMTTAIHPHSFNAINISNHAFRF